MRKVVLIVLVSALVIAAAVGVRSVTKPHRAVVRDPAADVLGQ